MRRWLFIAVIATAAAAIAYSGGLTGLFVAADVHAVSRVVDGDTLVLDNGQTVRLLGIDTPERGQKHWLEAKALLESKVMNRTIKLEKDVEDKDKYNRLLRWIFSSDELVNLALVQAGYAKTLFYADVKYRDALLAAEATAKARGLRIWSDVGYADVCIGLYHLQYNAPGDDNENLNGESVELRNACTHSMDLTRWTAQDNSTKAYTFPSFTLQAKSIVTLHTGSGIDNATDLFWGLSAPLWNNNGDRLIVADAKGNLMPVVPNERNYQ